MTEEEAKQLREEQTAPKAEGAQKNRRAEALESLLMAALLTQVMLSIPDLHCGGMY